MPADDFRNQNGMGLQMMQLYMPRGVRAVGGRRRRRTNMAAVICCNLTEEDGYGYAQVPMDDVKHHDLVALPWAGHKFSPPYLRIVL